MSSYEDVYGMATSIIEALKNIQWKIPSQWELESIIEPISEQFFLKLSKSQNLAASPTLATPTNIAPFLSNIQPSIEDPTQLFRFIAFLIAVPFFSTIFVAMFTNVNIVLKVLGLPLARNPVKASPLTVILVMVTVFGNIPLVNFFPEYAAHVQAPFQVYPGHYTGVIARVLQIVAFYEQFELIARVLHELVMIVRYRRIQITRLLRPASIVAWLLTFAGFALRMWFTRVSTDTATSPVQSGSTIWVWRDVTLRADVSYQSKKEFREDVIIWVTYFVTTFCVSSLFIKYVLTPRHGTEAYQPVEPIIIKLTGSSSIQTASVGCQTIVTGDDWVTKSSIATDAGRIDKIQDVIDSDMKRTSYFSRAWCHQAYFAAEDLKDLTLIWQNDHTALQTHVSLLRSFRIVVERHKEEARKQRQFAENVSTNVIRLEETLSEREKEYEEKLKLREQEYQDRLKELLLKLDALENGTDSTAAALDDTNKQEASQPDASLGPREAESQSVSANTPELQNAPEISATVQCASKSDTKSPTDLAPPSPPSSADDSSSPSGNSNDDKNPESVAEKVDAPATDCAFAPAAAAVSSMTESGIEPEKASDSEMDAANASGGSDDEIMEEIGTGIWSRVQKFQFRTELLAVRKDNLVRQHFTVQEIQDITALLIEFRDKIANDTQHEQVSILLNAGFPYRMGLKYERDLDYVSVFLDLAELNKKSTRARIFTEIPPMAFAYMCGIHPQEIFMINDHGRTWSIYRQRMLNYMVNGMDTLTGEDKAHLQKNKIRILNNLERFLGVRSELLGKVALAQAPKTGQVWDMNLIARRLLENFGLLEFRMVSTEGTSMEEYVPPALLEPAPVRLRIIETPSIKTSSAEVVTTAVLSETPSIETPPAELPTAVPAFHDAPSTTTEPTCGETPSLEVQSEVVPATTSTCIEILTIGVPPEVPAAVSTFNETSSIQVPSAELAVAVPTCNQSPSLEALSADLSATLPTCKDPTPSEPLAVVVPDKLAQLQLTSPEALPQSTPQATPVPSDSSMAPCIESPSQVLPPVSQARPSLVSSASPSTVTPTRATPSKFTAPDWRQEALQDMALQQQTQRSMLPLPQRKNGRKSRGRGPTHSNA